MALLQIIYSTLEHGQFLANYPLQRSQLINRKSLINFATGGLLGRYCFLPNDWKKYMIESNILPETKAEDIPTICKLSLCIIGEPDFIIPDWFFESKGKIWWKDLHPNVKQPF